MGLPPNMRYCRFQQNTGPSISLRSAQDHRFMVEASDRGPWQLSAAVAAASGTVAVASASAITPVAAVMTSIMAVAGTGRHGGGRRGQVGAAFGVDNEVALLAFAEGVRFDVFHVFEAEVQHAALAGVGGREAIGLAGGADA